MKILIETPTWLGDSVMATPAIENLLSFYDKAEISIIGSPVSIEIFKNHPKITKIKALERRYLSLYRISKNLGKFDVFFSFRNSFRSRAFKFLISSNKKFQFNSNSYKDIHLVEKYNGFINDSLNTSFDAGKLIIKSSLNSNPRKLNKVFGINPGASYGDAKRWYPKYFADVASDLSSQYDIIIFGGPGEKDIAADIEKHLIEYGVKNYQNIAGKTSIKKLIYEISNLDLLITGDSGPMHLAAAFQVPTVAIFGPTNDKETSQWMNEKSIIVKKNLECQPCMKRECPLKHHNCMRQVKASDVLQEVKRLR